MKIIVSHHLVAKKSCDKWIYFGYTFDKQKKVEEKIGGKRISISHQTKNHFRKNKLSLSEWVEKFKEKRSISSWISHFACRNNLVSKIFLNLCQLLAIKEVIRKMKKNEDILIICEDVFLINFLINNIGKKINLENNIIIFFINIIETMSLCVSGYAKQIRILFKIIRLKIISKLTLTQNKKIPKGKILLFHLALESEKKIECKYFGKLPSWFSKKKNNVFKIPWFLNNDMSFKYINTFRKNNFLIFDDFLNFSDYLSIYNLFFKSFKIFNKNINFKNINVQPLLKREKLFHLKEPSPLFLRAIPSLKKITKDATKIISYDHYENMPFEHPLRFALNDLPIKTVNVGFFHSLVSNNFFVYSHNKTEWRSKIKPDYVICTGSLSKRYLRKNNTPSKKILIASALRQQIIKKNSKTKKNIIILLPLEFSSSVEMLSKIYEDRDKIFKNLNNKVIIKPHPLSNIVLILKKSNIKTLPNKWQISNRNINEEINRCLCSISMSSASIYDSVLNDTVSISLKSEFDLYDNYLDFINSKYINYCNTKDVNDILKILCLKYPKNYNDNLKKVRKIIKNGINLPNKNNLKRFIIKN